MPTSPTLHGQHVRLEPLASSHIDALLAAAQIDLAIYRWTVVPQSRAEMERYVATALTWCEQGTALPFATVRQSDGAIIGSTRFFLLEHWAWPEGHGRHGRSQPDAGEIGYTWLAAGAIRTAANTEAKLLMLTHAFETWGMLRVCFHTDARNTRSAAALERIGAQFEGILRSHRIAVDNIARNSSRFSIIAAEWPEVKARLEQRLGADGR
jgi:RimJ/RimL family protein N-acetyltransferase